MTKAQVKAKLNRLLEDHTIDDIVEELESFFSFNQLKEFANHIEPNVKGDNNDEEDN